MPLRYRPTARARAYRSQAWVKDMDTAAERLPRIASPMPCAPACVSWAVFADPDTLLEGR